MTVDISKDLKVVVGEERRVQGSRMRNAVPPPMTEEVQVSGTGRAVLSLLITRTWQVCHATTLLAYVVLLVY